jgi:hypothetical protein
MSSTKRFSVNGSEVEAIFTSYMRLAHDIDLKVDVDRVVRLLESAAPKSGKGVRKSTTTEKSGIPGSFDIKLLEVDDTKIEFILPQGFPVVKKSGVNSYYCETPWGRPVVAVKYVDLEKMTLRANLNRRMLVGLAVAELLLEKTTYTVDHELVVEEKTEAKPKKSKKSKSTKSTTKATRGEYPDVATKREKRLLDHEWGVCFCNTPVGHKCPAVRKYGAKLPVLVIVE